MIESKVMKIVSLSSRIHANNVVNGKTRVVRSRYNEHRTKITFIDREPIYVVAEGVFRCSEWRIASAVQGRSTWTVTNTHNRDYVMRQRGNMEAYSPSMSVRFPLGP
ncbi:hypothetical protein ANTPLA_LOCUS5463 [Anthophora plagiata]